MNTFTLTAGEQITRNNLVWMDKYETLGPGQKDKLIEIEKWFHAEIRRSHDIPPGAMVRLANNSGAWWMPDEIICE